MGASGSGIFDDDLAWDVREGYRRLLQDRVPDDETTRRTIAAWAELGSDEVPILWLALAIAQSQVGRLEPEVRDRALVAIDSGEDLARWHRLGPGASAARASALAEVAGQRGSRPMKASSFVCGSASAGTGTRGPY